MCGSVSCLGQAETGVAPAGSWPTPTYWASLAGTPTYRGSRRLIIRPNCIRKVPDNERRDQFRAYSCPLRDTLTMCESQRNDCLNMPRLKFALLGEDHNAPNPFVSTARLVFNHISPCLAVQIGMLRSRYHLPSHPPFHYPALRGSPGASRPGSTSVFTRVTELPIHEAIERNSGSTFSATGVHQYRAPKPRGTGLSQDPYRRALTKGPGLDGIAHASSSSSAFASIRSTVSNPSVNQP
jgi:hypothetical protein